MAAVARYLAGTSALARMHHPAVAAVLVPLIAAGAVATCGAIEFELSLAPRSSAGFDQLRTDRDAGYEWLATRDEDWRRALDVQALLRYGERMRSVGFPPCSLPPWPSENESPSCTTTVTTTSSPTSEPSRSSG